MVRHPKSVALLLVLLVLLSGCSQYRFHGIPYEPRMAAPAIIGQNHDGSPFDLAALRGKAVLLFFGYTSCPDVCPTTLAEMRVLYANLGERATNTAVVFVSVDPERDTVSRLGEYVPLFNPNFYGVHVSDEQLAPIKSAYGVVAEKVYYKPEDTAAGYSVDHTARLYLISPASQLITSYPYGSDITKIQEDVEFLLK